MTKEVHEILFQLAEFVKYSQRAPMIIGWIAIIAFSAMYMIVSLLALAGVPSVPKSFEFQNFQNIEITGNMVLSAFAYISLLFYFLGSLFKKAGWRRRVLPKTFNEKVKVSFLFLVGIFMMVSLFHIAIPGNNGTAVFWILGIGSLVVFALTSYSLIIDLIVDTVLNWLAGNKGETNHQN